MPSSARRWPNASPPRRGTPSAVLLTVLAVVATALAACSPPGQPGPRDPTYAELGRQALQTLEHGYYNGAGKWNVCVPHICGTGNVDWGVDSLTYALYFHWSLTHDRARQAHHERAARHRRQLLPGRPHVQRRAGVGHDRGRP